jgi:DNA-binding transcriptional ArsR family regulator
MDRFVALADPTRRQIVELLGSGEQAAGAIGARFPVSAPAISQHLKTLRIGPGAGPCGGAAAHLQPRSRRLREMDAWFAKMRGFWSDRLDALERELSQEDEK